MPSRRRLLRNAAALTLGGLVASAPATAQSPDSPSEYPRYDAGAVADTETVVAATCDPAVVSETPLPAAVRNRLAALRRRYDAFALSDIQRLTGSVGANDTAVEGCVTLAGAFDADAADAELRADDTLRRHPDEGGLRRFDAPNVSVSLAFDDQLLRVGYAPDPGRATDHLEAAISGSESSTDDTHGALPALLDGDAAVYARLGDRERQRAIDALGDKAPDELGAVLSRAKAVGLSLYADPGQSRIRYGAVGARLGIDTVRRLAADARQREDALSDVRLYRQGRTIVADAAVETAAAWNAHTRLLGRETDAEAHGLTMAGE